MATKKKAAKAKGKAAPTASGVPAKLTVRGGGKAPKSMDDHVVHAAKAITLSSGEGFVRRGQLSLYLATVAKVCETAAEANAAVADAYDAGLLNGYVAPAKEEAA